MAPAEVKYVTVELTESAAQEVLRTVEKDPDSTHWGEGNQVRNEVTAALRSALSAEVRTEDDETEAAQEPAEDDDPGSEAVPDEPEADVETEDEVEETEEEELARWQAEEDAAQAAQLAEEDANKGDEDKDADGVPDSRDLDRGDGSI